MKPHIEAALWDAIGHKLTVRDLISALLLEGHIKSPKEAWATLNKWHRKGIYEYGVALDLGWKKK